MTSTPSGPVSARRAATSCGEQTKPRIPASRPIRPATRPARRASGRGRWRSAWAASMLVSTVTASSSGGSAMPSSAAWAADSMAGPPAACTVIMRTPEGGSRAHRSGHGVGNVVELEVEEDGMAARDQRLDDGGPAATNSSSPTLNQWQVSSNWLTSSMPRRRHRARRGPRSGACAPPQLGQRQASAGAKLGFIRSGMGILYSNGLSASLLRWAVFAAGIV